MFFKKKIYKEAFIRELLKGILQLKKINYDQYSSKRNIFNKDEIEKINKEFYKIILLYTGTIIIGLEEFLAVDEEEYGYIFGKALGLCLNESNIEDKEFVFNEYNKVLNIYDEYIEKNKIDEEVSLVAYKSLNQYICELLSIKLDIKNYQNEEMINKVGEVSYILKLYFENVKFLIYTLYKNYKLI